MNYSSNKMILFAGMILFFTHLVAFPYVGEGMSNNKWLDADYSTIENKTKTYIVDIELFSGSCGDLNVNLRPNIDITDNYITNIQFTIKWPANTVSLINFNSDYGIELQGQVVIENDTNYAVFVSTTVYPINWVAGNEYSILTFSHDQSGNGIADIMIDDGPWAKQNNGIYYVEFLGEDFTGIIFNNANNIFLGHCGELDLTVFLQSSYNPLSGLMNTTLNSISSFPLTQPYSGSPWNYSGSENITEVHADIVDWLFIELRDAPDAASATLATKVGQKAALLLENGKITGMDGVSTIQFNNSMVENLFVVIWHRNHLGIISANEIFPIMEDYYSYDFSLAESQAFGNGQNDLGNGKYGMIAGDANADGVINILDLSQVWKTQTGSTGYLQGDMNLDGQVHNIDKNDFWFINLSIDTHVPE